ncbi:hypothetical protein CSC22_5229 (plasmid) [Escherichia coli]|nr:hypothetical protein CSC22_5229 [Escherichia coli]
MSGNGYIYIPCIATTGNPVKLMLQWGMVATQKGVDAGYALPFAFPMQVCLRPETVEHLATMPR